MPLPSFFGRLVASATDPQGQHAEDPAFELSFWATQVPYGGRTDVTDCTCGYVFRFAIVEAGSSLVCGFSLQVCPGVFMMHVFFLCAPPALFLLFCVGELATFR